MISAARLQRRARILMCNGLTSRVTDVAIADMSDPVGSSRIQSDPVGSSRIQSSLKYLLLSLELLADFGRVVADVDGEVDRDAGLGFDGLSILHVGLEAPLADGLLGGGGQNCGAGDYSQVLDVAVGADDRLQYDRALNLHLLREQWIRIRSGRGFDRGAGRRDVGRRDRGGHGHALGGVGGWSCGAGDLKLRAAIT